VRLTAAIVGGLLAVLVARPTWAAECAADEERVEFASVTFCIANANDLYRYTINEFLGLTFVPQTFIADERVPSESYYDADGNAPIDGTYVTVSIKPPRFGRLDVQRYERRKYFLNEPIKLHPGEKIFEQKQGRGKVTFRRLDESIVIASTTVPENGVLVIEVWLHLDGADEIEHMLHCEHFVARPATHSDSPMECMSWFPIGTSLAIMQLSGMQLSGDQLERSYRLSRQIRSDIEGFIKKGSNP
jgi:hypothetical protein